MWDQDQKYIAQGCLTNSKHPDRFVKGVYPTHAVEAKGCEIVGSDGKRYIDFICGLGTNLIGYNNVKISQAVAAELYNGFSPSLPTKHAAEAAEALTEIYPWVEKWKFLKTGSEACSAAVRIARAYTKEWFVGSKGYHGHMDLFISLTEPSHGVPDDYRIGDTCFPGELSACSIIEPDFYDADRLQLIRDHCNDVKALLIYDEVVTSLRYRHFSVSQDTKIRPDLIIVGKSMAGGLPLAAVGGPSAIMDADYFVSSTYAGETLSLAACKEMCKLVQTTYINEDLWKTGGRFKDRFNAISPNVQIDGYNTRGSFRFLDKRWEHLFYQECCKAGLLFGPSWFWAYPHADHADSVIAVVGDILDRIESGQCKMEGVSPTSPFSKGVRDGRK